MTWIALCDFEQPVFHLDGIERRTTSPSSNQALLSTGTLLIETLLSPSSSDQVILDYRCAGDWPLRLNIQRAACGTFWIYIEQGQRHHIHALPTDLAHYAGTVEVSYSWDGPKRVGSLSVSAPQTGAIFSNRLTAPNPLPMQALHDMVMGTAGQRNSASSTYFALSNAIEPVGVPATLSLNSRVRTPLGQLPLGQISTGMTVNCQRHGPQIVDWVGAFKRPARGSALPIRLRAPYLGLQQDLIVAADQRVAMGGPDVEYLFAEETVLVRARDLIHGPMAMIEMGPKLMTYGQLYLERHALLDVNGCATESLHMTHSAQQTFAAFDQSPELVDLGTLPHHTAQARPGLRGFEAMTLNRVLVA